MDRTLAVQMKDDVAVGIDLCALADANHDGGIRAFDDGGAGKRRTGPQVLGAVDLRFGKALAVKIDLARTDRLRPIGLGRKLCRLWLGHLSRALDTQHDELDA